MGLHNNMVSVHTHRWSNVTYKCLYKLITFIDSMAKATVRLISAKQYAEYKSLVNRYEREWRLKHPKEHKEESKALLHAILKNRGKK